MTDFKCQFKIEHSLHERLAKKKDSTIMLVCLLLFLLFAFFFLSTSFVIFGLVAKKKFVPALCSVQC